jgi:hypothetical protein
MDLAPGWKLIKQERLMLARMGPADRRLAEKESAVDEALIHNNEPGAKDHLKAYLALVSKEFRKVDKELKDLCMQLSRLSPALQTVLNLC